MSCRSIEGHNGCMVMLNCVRGYGMCHVNYFWIFPAVLPESATHSVRVPRYLQQFRKVNTCLLYTSDAADE